MFKRYSLFTLFVGALFFSCASSPNSGDQRFLTVADSTLAMDLKSGKKEEGKLKQAVESVQKSEETTFGVNSIDSFLEEVQIYEKRLSSVISLCDVQQTIDVADSLLTLYKTNSLPADYAPIIQERTLLVLENVRAFLSSISLDVLESPAETVAGTAFKKSYRIQVSCKKENSTVPLASFPVAITDTRAQLSIDGISKTDSEGLVVYAPETPKKAAKTSIVFSAALEAQDTDLKHIINDLSQNGPLKAEASYLVSTNGKRRSSSISILDYDKNGKPMLYSNPSATYLLKPLINKGFSPIGMADFPNQINAGNTETLFKAAKNLFGSSVRQFIWGTVKIEQLEKESDGLWTCSIEVHLAVQDLVANESLYSETFVVEGRGKTETTAIDEARKKAMTDIAVDALLYGI